MIFVEVIVTDPSDFDGGLAVRGEVLHDRYRVMTMEAARCRTLSRRWRSPSATSPA